MTNSKVTPEDINQINRDTMISHLGIEFTEIKDDYLVAKMPVDERTFQPMGLLHGGANVTLAETLGSVGSYITIDPKSQYAVCLEINANHTGTAMSGFVHGYASLIHKGKSTHIWSVEVKNDQDKLISVSRLTMMILDRKDQ